MTTTLPHNGTAESIAAAKSAVPKSAQDRRAIAAFIAKQGAAGATDEEIAEALSGQIHPDALRVRRGECYGFGMITHLEGERRLTKSGNMARVHHITDRGTKALDLPAGTWCVVVKP